MTPILDNKSIKNLNQVKKSKSFSTFSIIRLILGIILIIGICLGIGLSIPKMTSNYESRGDFTHSYNFKLKLDTSDVEEPLQKIDKTANTLSNYMRQHGVIHYDTAYEYDENSKEGHITVNLPTDTVESKLLSDKGIKVDNDPFINFFKNTVDTDKTFVYKWWGLNSDATGSFKGRKVYSILNFSDIFEINSPDTKITTNVDGKSGILWRISKSNWELLQNIYIDFYRFSKFLEKNAKDKEEKKSSVTIPEEAYPRLLVINNLNGLFNDVNYHLMSYAWHDEVSDDGNSEKQYRQIYDDANEYHSFAKEIFNDYNGVYDSTKPKGDKVTSCLDHAYRFKVSDQNEQDYETSKDSWLENADLFRFIDTNHLTKNAWLQQYVDRYYDYSSYKNFFPEKITSIYENKISIDDIDTSNYKSYFNAETLAEKGIDLNLEYAWQMTGSAEAGKKYLDDYKNYKWDVKQMPFVRKELGTRPTMDEFSSFLTSSKQSAIFSNNIFQSNNIEGALIVGLVCFLIGLLVVLACLYKIFGLLGGLTLLFMLSMTSMILLSFAGIVFSLSFLIGLYCLALAGGAMIISICERIKRQAKNGFETSLYVKKGFNKGLSACIDISFITLVFGILFTYAATSSLMPLGSVLILGSMFAFFICYGLNFLIHFLLFGDITMPNFWKWIFKPSFELAKSNNVLGDDNFDFDFYCKKANGIKLQIFSKKAFFALGAVGLILIVGWIFFGVFGFFSPALFSSSNTPENLHVLFKSNFDITLTSWLMAAIASLAISFFLGFRHNWTAILPSLATNLIVLLLFVAASSLLFIKFDETSTFGLIITMFMANITIACYVELINSAWNRKKSYSAFEFKHLINTTLKNSIWFWIVNTINVVLFVIAFAISCPNQTWWLSIASLLGLVVVIGIVPWSISYLLYWCLIWRNIWIGSKEKKEKINYDIIDEQEIKGINC